MSSTYGSYRFNGQIITLCMYKEYERKYYLEEFKRRGWIEDLEIEYLQKQTYSKLTLLNANKPYKKAMHHSYYSKRMWATNYGSYL